MKTPYIVAWSGEVGHIVRPDPHLGGWMALFSAVGAPGQGSPVYASLSESRQRLAEDVQVWQQGGMRDPRTWLTAVDAPETEYQAPQPGERFKVGGMGGPIVYEQTPAGEPWKYIGYASLVEPKP